MELPLFFWLSRLRFASVARSCVEVQRLHCTKNF